MSRSCSYRCVECGADMPADTDCPACLEREASEGGPWPEDVEDAVDVDGSPEELSELQQQLQDADELAELAIAEADNA